MTLNFLRKFFVWNDFQLFSKNLRLEWLWTFLQTISIWNIFNFHKTSPSGMTLNFCKNTRLECLWTFWRKKEKNVRNDFDNFAKASVWNNLEPFPVWNDFERLTQNPHLKWLWTSHKNPRLEWFWAFGENPRLKWLWTFHKKSLSGMTLNIFANHPCLEWIWAFTKHPRLEWLWIFYKNPRLEWLWTFHKKSMSGNLLTVGDLWGRSSEVAFPRSPINKKKTLEICKYFSVNPPPNRRYWNLFGCKTFSLSRWPTPPHL